MKKGDFEMEKRYLVTGSWHDKTTGKPMSGIAEISSGRNKAGQPFEFLNTDSRETPIEGTYAVGTILIASISLAQESPSKAPLNLKSSSQ
ncbi:hypothetical protein [Cohnella terricola]|uniref:Uncharacterized protein n=1 Tax=Cohnella terricola TaxID=1289167 RepID=A0A559JBS6_9BACL|nr:hypothetical protein [Cohnella terricola]TVX97332.1 hypothetical protein FPZ45_18510 [Cohnella terricola]